MDGSMETIDEEEAGAAGACEEEALKPMNDGGMLDVAARTPRCCSSSSSCASRRSSELMELGPPLPKLPCGPANAFMNARLEATGKIGARNCEPLPRETEVAPGLAEVDTADEVVGVPVEVRTGAGDDELGELPLETALNPSNIALRSALKILRRSL